MKITINEKSKNVFFRTIKIGDVFLFEGEYYLKIPIAAINDDALLNALAISDWSYLWIENDDMVMPVNAELVINE